MNVRNSSALIFIAALLSTAAFGADPASTPAVEEIVVTAPYPAHLLIEEIVLTAPKPINPIAEKKDTLAELTDEIALKPEIILTL